MDTDTAIGVALRNLKGAVDKDIMLTAEALATIRADPEYASTARVATVTQVSREIVREFLSLLELPGPVQDLFRKRKLRTLEQGRKLRQLMRSRSKDVESAAAAMVGMTAHESRELVGYLVRHPDVDISSAIETIRDARTRRVRLFYVMVDLEEPDFARLRDMASRNGLEVGGLAAEILREGLEAREAPGA